MAMTRPALPREHGTMRGVRQHWQRKERLCDKCRETYGIWRRVGDGYATKANGYWNGNTTGRPSGTGKPKGLPRCGKPMKQKPVKDGSVKDNPICGRPEGHAGKCSSVLALQKQAERFKEWRKDNARLSSVSHGRRDVGHCSDRDRVFHRWRKTSETRYQDR